MKYLNKKKDQTIFQEKSFSAFKDYLRLNPQCLKTVYCGHKMLPQIQKVLDSAAHSRIQQVVTDQPDGFSFDVEIRGLTEVEFFEDMVHHRPRCLIALDEVSDPRNFGAVVRSASFFGVPYVVIKKNRQALLSEVVISTAQGGFATVKPVIVVNLSRFLTRLKDHSFWVIGADVDGEPVDRVTGVYDATVLVLGSEGSGLRHQTQKICDRMVRVPGCGKGVQSLNVSVAAGIVMSRFCAIE